MIVLHSIIDRSCRQLNENITLREDAHMFRSRNPRLRVVAVFALMLIFSAIAYGFAAANTVPASNAGDGSNAVSGYTITSVHYVLNAANPANIDTVTFTTAPAVPAGGVVKVQVSQGAATTWHNC